MSPQPSRKREAGPIRLHEEIVNFDPDSVVAPFALRCGALIIDYLIFIGIPVAFLLFSRVIGYDGVGLLTSGLNDIGWVTATLVVLVSQILLPIAAGRSLGKFATGIRIVASDGSEAGHKRVLVRQLLAIVLFPLTLGISFIWAAIDPRGRTLHDLISGTMVIYANKRTIKAPAYGETDS